MDDIAGVWASPPPTRSPRGRSSPRPPAAAPPQVYVVDHAEPLSEPMTEELQRLRLHVDALEGRRDPSALPSPYVNDAAPSPVAWGGSPMSPRGALQHHRGTAAAGVAAAAADATEIQRLQNENRYLAEDNRILREANAALEADLADAHRAQQADAQALEREVEALRAENTRIAGVEQELRLKLEQLSKADHGRRESQRELEKEREKVTYLNHLKTQVTQDLESYKELYANAMGRCDRLEAESIENKVISAEIRDQRAHLVELLEATRQQAAGRSEEADGLAQRIISLSASNAILHQRVEAYDSQQLDVDLLKERISQLTAENDDLTTALESAPTRRRSRSSKSRAPPPAKEPEREPEKALIVPERVGFSSSTARDVCDTHKEQRVGTNSPRGREAATAPLRSSSVDVPPHTHDAAPRAAKTAPRTSRRSSSSSARTAPSARLSSTSRSAKTRAGHATPLARGVGLERADSFYARQQQARAAAGVSASMPTYNPYRTRSRSRSPPGAGGDTLSGMRGVGFGSSSKEGWYPSGVPHTPTTPHDGGVGFGADEDAGGADEGPLSSQTTPAHEPMPSPAFGGGRPTSTPTRSVDRVERDAAAAAATPTIRASPRSPLVRKLAPTPRLTNVAQRAEPRSSPRSMSAGASRRAEVLRNRPPVITANNSLFRSR